MLPVRGKNRCICGSLGCCGLAETWTHTRYVAEWGERSPSVAESLDRLSSAVREVVSRRKTSKGWRCPERRRSDETQIIRERWMRGGGGRRVGVPQWLTVTAFSSHFCDDAKAGILACIVISSSVSHPSS